MRQWGTGAPWHWDDQWGSGLNWSHPEMSFYIFQTGNASFYFKLCLLMTSGFSRTVQYIRIRAFPYFWHQLYLMEETRLWQVDKCIERFSSCLDWEKLTMAVAWSVMGCLSLIRNRFWVWEETTGIWVSHGGSKRKKMSALKRKCPIALIISRSLWVLIEICWKASSHAFWSRLETRIQWQRTEFEMLFSSPILFTVARCCCELVFGSCFDVAHRKLCIVFLHC